MLILIHVILALSSIVSSSYSFIRPSKAKLNLTYGLAVGTLASGSYLVISTSSGLVSACVTGLIYLGIVSLGILGAQRKLANENIVPRNIK